MIVKVCGVRTPDVADAAIAAGADWIGLVFEPRSVRYVDDAAALSVVDAVGKRADVVGVFVNADVATTDASARRYGLSAVQVHSAVDPGFAVASSVPVIRGLNVRTVRDALHAEWWPDCLVLLDAAPDGDALPGGTGKHLDRSLAAEIAAHRRIILAGGLTPEDVADAIREVRPEGVDASSGLESAPGVKDPERVTRFINNARAAT